jgi:cytochrome P450
LRANPSAIYRSPAAPHDPYTVLSRYADVQLALRDPAFGRRDTADVAYPNLGDGPLANSFVCWMVFRDPPDHTRLRNLVTRAFTPRAVERLASVIHDLVDRLLEPLAERSAFDLVTEFAYALPVFVICELLRVPAADRARFGAWSAALARSLDPSAASNADDVGNGNTAAQGITSYFRALIAERRAIPADDLLSGLAAVDVNGDRLTEDELLANCVFLFFAGHETTVNLIGNGLLALLRQPDQLEQLRAQPRLATQAVEELLRFDSPVQRTGRVALTDVALGQPDPASGPTEDPDWVSLIRPAAHRHLAFAAGKGLHVAA